MKAPALWSKAFWQAANEVAAKHGFTIEIGNHKDHYRLFARRRGTDKKACLAAFKTAGLLETKWVS